MLAIVVRICIDIHNLAITVPLFLTCSIFEEFLCVVGKAKPMDAFCGVKH